MPERQQSIETGFDSTRWYHVRHAAHVVKNEDGDVVSHVDYRS